MQHILDMVSLVYIQPKVNSKSVQPINTMVQQNNK